MENVCGPGQDVRTNKWGPGAPKPYGHSVEAAEHSGTEGSTNSSGLIGSSILTITTVSWRYVSNYLRRVGTVAATGPVWQIDSSVSVRLFIFLHPITSLPPTAGGGTATASCLSVGILMSTLPSTLPLRRAVSPAVVVVVPHACCESVPWSCLFCRRTTACFPFFQNPPPPSSSVPRPQSSVPRASCLHSLVLMVAFSVKEEEEEGEEDVEDVEKQEVEEVVEYPRCVGIHQRRKIPTVGPV